MNLTKEIYCSRKKLEEGAVRKRKGNGDEYSGLKELKRETVGASPQT